MVTQLRSYLLPFITVCIIFGTAAAIIGYGRGYRVGIDGSVKPTGLIVIQSEPSGAQIIIDDKVKTATQATLTLAPGWYTVTVAKDGFQQWQKRMKVQGEVVTKVEALLLPTNPSLTALTASGVVNPVLSPDGSKLAYIIPDTILATESATIATNKPGIWILDLADKPLGLNRDARQIAKATTINLNRAILSWSPDSKEILASLSPTSNYLFLADQLNVAATPVTDIKLLQNDWQKIKDQRLKEQLVTVPPVFINTASESAKLLSFSPDETKILYEATASATLPQIISPALIGTNPTEETRAITPGNVYVYDIKEDRNYKVGDAELLRSIAVAKNASDSPRSNEVKAPDITSLIHWLPTSRHMVVTSKDKVEIMDYDGANRRTAYAGPFWDSFAVPWASGGKIVILTNLNSLASAVNNLYVVNLK